MTATDDCNMIAITILNLISIPLLIKMGIDIYPYLLKGTMDMPAFWSAMDTIGFGFMVCFLCALIMGFGVWIDSLDLV